MDGLSFLTIHRNKLIKIILGGFLFGYAFLSFLSSQMSVETSELLWQSKPKSLVHSEVYPKIISPFDQRVHLKIHSNRALNDFEVSFNGGETWEQLPVLPKTENVYFLKVELYTPQSGSYIGFQQGFNSRNKLRGIFVRARDVQTKMQTQPLAVALFYDLIRPIKKGPPIGDPLKISDNRDADLVSTF